MPSVPLRCLPGLALALLAASCIERRSNLPPLPPPPETGQVTTDMNDVWRIDRVDLLDAIGPIERYLQRQFLARLRKESEVGLAPLFEGATFELQDDRFVNGNRLPMLREEVADGDGIRRYDNRVLKDQFAFYDFVYENPPRLPERGSFVLKIVIGALSDDRLLGHLYFERSGSFLPPQELRAAFFRFSAVRAQ